MGFGRGKRRGKQRKAQAGAADGNPGGVARDDWASHVPAPALDNARFAAYYAAQPQFFNELHETGGAGAAEAGDNSLDALMDALRSDLPTTFRFTGSRASAGSLRDAMRTEFFDDLVARGGISADTDDGATYPPPSPIPWYPDQLAWQVDMPRRFLRRSEKMRQFQKFLVAETMAGNISRQEAVSMIPVLLLDVQPGMRVLDMCAAPGSKTAQIIEALYPPASAEQQRSLAMPSGIVMANDADYKRSHMLVHQTKRLQSPCVMITNHDAQFYPAIHTQSGEPMLFDRILADVPCSGDGTLRKNRLIWKTWTPTNGAGLHAMQAQIALRAAQLLKKGARMVYSTCSLNPIENEAVVASLLNAAPGLRLVSVDDKLPNLKRRKGMTKWVIPDRDQQQYFGSYDEVVAARADFAKKREEARAAMSADVDGADGENAAPSEDVKTEEVKKKSKKQRKRERKEQGNLPRDPLAYIAPSFFPPANVNELNLDRCLRILPHDQNTGGFFVAVLELVADTWRGESVVAQDNAGKSESAASESLKRPAEADDSSVKRPRTEEQSAASDVVAAMDEETDMTLVADVTESSTNTSPVPAEEGEEKRVGWVGKGEHSEEPFLMLPSSSPYIAHIHDYFGVPADFPRDLYVVRSESGAPTVLYLVNDAVRDILTAPDSHKLNIVVTGVRTFVRNESAHKALLRDREQRLKAAADGKGKGEGEGEADSKPVSKSETTDAALVAEYNVNETTPYRISDECIQIVGPLLAKRTLRISRDDILIMLEREYPRLTSLTESTANALRSMAPGCLIIIYDPSADAALKGEDSVTESPSAGLHAPLLAPVWRAPVSVQMLVARTDKINLYARITGKDLGQVKDERKAEVERELQETKDVDDQVHADKDAEPTTRLNEEIALDDTL